MESSADGAIGAAQSYASRLISQTELDTKNRDVEGYSAATIALSNIAIAQAIADLADAIRSTRD